MRLTKLERILDRLQERYGAPAPPYTTNAFEMVLLENIAYLVSDAKRRAAFEALRTKVGLDPAQILKAPDDVLLEVTRMGGMHPEERVQRLKMIAALALKEPVRHEKKNLMRFPSIGEPGAEKILLFTGAAPLLALDSNGLRVLVRVGYGSPGKSYAVTYHSAQKAAAPEIAERCPERVRAYELLRRHGQELCKNNGPDCGACPVAKLCAYNQPAPLTKPARRAS